MKIRNLFVVTLLAAGAMGTLPVLAQVNTTVQVILPGGRAVYVPNTKATPWYRRQEFTRYHYSRYRYDPRQHAYVVLDERHHDDHGRSHSRSSHDDRWHAGRGPWNGR